MLLMTSFLTTRPTITRPHRSNSKMRPIATNGVLWSVWSVWSVCLSSVYLLVTFVIPEKKQLNRSRCGLRGLGADLPGPIEPCIKWVKMPHGKGQFWGCVEPTEKHCESAEVYLAEQIQSSTEISPFFPTLGRPGPPSRELGGIFFTILKLLLADYYTAKNRLSQKIR